MGLYGVVGGEVGVQCCGVEGVRGHWSESPQVTTTKMCCTSWPQINFPPNLQKRSRKAHTAEELENHVTPHELRTLLHRSADVTPAHPPASALTSATVPAADYIGRLLLKLFSHNAIRFWLCLWQHALPFSLLIRCCECVLSFICPCPSPLPCF